MEKKRWSSAAGFLIPVFTLVLVILLFGLLYRYDNKYTDGPPYGQDGIFSFSQNDLRKPVYLIDGWKFYPNQLLSPADTGTKQVADMVFIGQKSNFSSVTQDGSPFGSATYEITLSYNGLPCTLALHIPETFSRYTLWADDEMIASTGSGNLACFSMDDSVTLLLAVTNDSHYYSGMVYPMALGTPGSINRLQSCQGWFYGILCIATVTLALFSSVLWLSYGKDALFLHYGILCIAFGISCAHGFVWQWGGSGPLWYAIEDSARMLLFAESIALTTTALGFAEYKWYRHLVRPLTLLSVLLTCLLVGFIIPKYSFFVNIYGTAAEGWRVFCWLYLMVCAGQGWRNAKPLSLFTLAGGAALGTGILGNLLDNGYYEPIYTGWQYEYAGFVMILIFSGMMVWYNYRILKENEKLTLHLGEMVSLKTAQLEAVLEERKNFFSDMAHSLKSPVASIHGFIDLIRSQNICIDAELSDYLNAIDRKNLEVSRRIQSLNTLNTFDRIQEPSVLISVTEILKQIESNYRPEADAAGIYLVVEKQEKVGRILAQPEKLSMLFENLIYNALFFTPQGGTIRISVKKQESGSMAAFLVADTGIGIAPEHLPHVFQRFYTIRKNPSEGSGLGLYITKLIVEEMGGTITVDSMEGEGSLFTIKLPLCE